MDINLKNFNLAQCIHGIMVWPTNDSAIGKCLPLYGEWSEGENIIMSEYINEGDTVIDIGANIGTTVLSMSKNVGKTGKVIAFEPQLIMSQCLNTNLTLNDITNVDIYNLAISNKSGWAKLNDHEFLQVDLDRGEPEEMVLEGLKKEGHDIKILVEENDWIRLLISPHEA